MRIPATMMIMMLLSLNAAFAATVNLTDGRSVQGDIIKQDNKSIQISVDGVNMTYYADEIKDIDGQPIGSGQAKPADVATVPVPVEPAPAEVQPVPEAQPEAVNNTVNAPAAAVAGAIDEDKRALILKFIDVFGTRQALTNNFESMIQQIEKEKPDEAQKIRQRVKVDEIIERLLPIYDRNFSSDDLKAFIAFYGSAEGQKLITTIPELMKESVQESVKYMEEKFPEVKQGQ
jgi:hypothetical protein